MNDHFDIEAWRTVVTESLAKLLGTIAGFLPSLVATVVILGLGWLLSRAAEAIATRTLRRFGLDRAARRLRLDRMLGRAGVEAPPSEIIGRLLFWVLMLTFVLSAVETLGLTAVTMTIDRLIAYLPNVIAAALILVLGLLLARLSGNVVASAAAATRFDQASRLGAATQSIVVAVIGVLALDQLGVQTQVLVTVISVLLGALSLTVGATFALAARPVASHILAGHFLRQSLLPGQSVEVQGRRGTVERVGAVDTVLSDGDRRWSLPNGRLLEEELVR